MSEKNTTDIPSPIQNPRNSFPAWRLPNGRINASDDQLEIASSSCGAWEWGCAALVVVAVIAEFIIAYIHPPYDSLLNQLGTSAADAAIALGIVGEVIFSRLDSRIQTELRSRSNKKLGVAEKAAGEANERAAILLKGVMNHELQLRDLKQPRKFNLDKFKEAMALEPRTDAKAEILYVRDCPDCHWLATLIWGGLKISKWEIVKFGPIPEPTADKAHLPAAYSVKATPHGITVVSKAQLSG